MRIDAIFTDLDAHTLDPARPRATKIGVSSGRIIGFDEELDGISADRVESLGGAIVPPGFNDVHCHTTWYGLTLASVDVTAMPGGRPTSTRPLRRRPQSPLPGSGSRRPASPTATTTDSTRN